jgi:tripartite-type tricarboxylate transporter receptor subunit TctC
MDLTGWWGVIVPKATPRPIVDQLNKWFVEIVKADDTKAFLNKFGGDPLVETVDEAQQRLIKDVESWKKYIEVAKIVPQG